MYEPPAHTAAHKNALTFECYLTTRGVAVQPCAVFSLSNIYFTSRCMEETGVKQASLHLAVCIAGYSRVYL